MRPERPNIEGFLDAPKLAAGGKPYRGRFTLQGVQWTGEGDELLATFTITAEELADMAASQLIWTDQDVQRGIRPGLSDKPPRELSISEGYPDPNLYVFDASNADDIVEKLLRGDRLFLGPLIWNLRPGTFEAYWDKAQAELILYSGHIYLPDSHHRQQAIVKAVRVFKDSPSSYPKFSPAKQFKVEVYFLSRQDEGNYFFDKNQRPKPTAKSKAYDLTTLDDLSLLAKSVISRSAALRDNVNRVTDRLTARNPQVLTLSTLREMMRSLAPVDSLDKPEIEGLATVAGTFYDLLAEIRPELGPLDQAQRRRVRERLVVDAAVMMHGYASLMRDFNESMAEDGMQRAIESWRKKLGLLSGSKTYVFDAWTGELFDKHNPLWQRIGVVKPGRDSKKLTVLNTGSARSECGRVLRQLVSHTGPVSDLRFLAVA